MVEHARLGRRTTPLSPCGYDANGIADGITEVLAYGTAVVVQQG